MSTGGLAKPDVSPCRFGAEEENRPSGLLRAKEDVSHIDVITVFGAADSAEVAERAQRRRHRRRLAARRGAGRHGR